MAEMIPESIHSGRPKGERDVFKILEKLPDDCIVYHEPVIANRYPDFVVLCPDLGLMVIEVKDWSVGNIDRGDLQQVILKYGNTQESHKHPIVQARDYMFTLMNRFQGDQAFSSIRHQEGQWQGRFIFPFGHLAILSKITFDQLEKSGKGAAFPKSRVVTRDVLECWDSCNAGQLKEALKGFFDPFWDFPKLTERQIDLLRAVIHPEIVVQKPLPLKDPSSNSRLYVLDKHQEVLARKIGDGHRVINGVAGSGKTVLLIHRARWLSSQDPNRRILVLCYNKCLATYLKNSLHDCQNVTATTFHQWGMSFGVRFNFKADKFGEKVLKKAIGMPPNNKFDTIFIDEAQDFDRSWFECVVAAMKDPEDGDLIVVADGNQGLYRPSTFKWIDVGIKARGRVLPLYKNYRNTEQIMRLARTFAEEQTEDSGEQIVALRPRESIRNGPAPIIFKASNRSQENDKIVDIIKGLLQGKWQQQPISPPLQPSEIAVIYPRLTQKTKKAFHELRAKTDETTGVKNVWLSDKEDQDAATKIDQPGIKFQTIHSCKGLQYRAVIYIWGDQLPMKGENVDESQEKRLMYVGLTRAEDFLAVTYTEGSRFTEMLESASREVPFYFVFHCEHCGYRREVRKSELPEGASRVRIKCPKCSEKTRFDVPT
jgi:hypothetical protein